jgi:hypothetical protein
LSQARDVLRRPAMRVFWTVLLLCACDHVPPVAIADQCTPLTDPVLLFPTASPGLGEQFSVGMVDRQVLLSRVTRDWDTMTSIVTAQWFDATLHPTTAEFSLGVGAAPNMRWIAFDGRLHGQVWTIPSGDPFAMPLRLEVGVDALAPGTTSIDRTIVALPITTSADSMTRLGVMEGPGGGPGLPGDFELTAAVGFGRPIFALDAIPADCGGFVTNMLRVMVFDGTAESTDELGDPACTGDVGRVTEFETYDEVLVPFEGGLGLFYRSGASGGETTGRLHYARVGSDLRVLDDPPIDVDDEVVNGAWLFPAGYQTHAAQVDDGPILYRTRMGGAGWNDCSSLRLVDPDGGHPRDAAWRMRCYVSYDDAVHHGAWAPWLSAWARIEPLEMGHAALVYDERTNFPPLMEYSAHVTADTDWDEGVYLTTINGLGQRTSDVVRITPAETTALDVITTPRTADDGPFPRDIPIATASEGSEVVIAWLDARPDAPGYYARRYACGAIEQ